MSRIIRDFFMININGKISSQINELSLNNRGYKYGDALFETIKAIHGRVLFWEDHYFRLMASMRIMRMDIPMTFTMEFLKNEIIKTIQANNLNDKSARIRLTIDRGEGGRYNPKSNNHINYHIQVEPLEDDFYGIANDIDYKIELYKDHYIAPSLLSTLKTNNRAINVIGSIFANENDYDNCLLINTNKQVVEALNGNIFLVNGNTIKTPPLKDGCIKGVIRKQLINIISELEEYTLVEESISPFELQKADELFITNVIVGIQPVSNYRKKSFKYETAKMLTAKLNLKARFS